MSLTNRVSLFFLAALGAVLAGFSATLYLLADRHLHARAEHRLDAAMQTLVAAVEVHPGDVEWEPLQRRITMGADAGPDQLRWSVRDLGGRLLDCSANLERPGGGGGSGWRALTRRVRAGSFAPETVDADAVPPFGESPDAAELPADRTYHGDGVVMAVALPDGPVAAELRQLALALAATSAATWLAAAVGGRWLCRRALAPIARMAASARAARGEGGGRPLDVAATRDELEDLGTAFNDLLADLRRSLERQHRFTGDASHQLRTPLAALLASVEVALRRERSPAEYQKALGVVRRRGGQLRQIIESLLFLARAESDDRLPGVEPTDLAAWCRARLDAWADHPRAADLSFTAAAAPAPVRANPALLGQALDNLLDNACKYSDPGTPVAVAVEVGAHTATLAVADRGCGVAPAEVPLVWEPFFRSAQARWTGAAGVGLGLTVARRLVTLHGGRLEVESVFGEGSTFRVTLPLNGAARPQAGQPAGPGQGDGAEEGANPGSGEAGIYTGPRGCADDTGGKDRPKAAVTEVEGRA